MAVQARKQNGMAHLILYVVFGVLTVVLNTAVYLLCRNICSVPISSVIAWICAVIFAYCTNRFFVFRSTKNTAGSIVREAAFFFLARICSEAAELLLLFLLLSCSFGAQNETVVKIAVNALIVIMNYGASKAIIFK